MDTTAWARPAEAEETPVIGKLASGVSPDVVSSLSEEDKSAFESIQERLDEQVLQLKTLPNTVFQSLFASCWSFQTAEIQNALRMRQVTRNP